MLMQVSVDMVAVMTMNMGILKIPMKHLNIIMLSLMMDVITSYIILLLVILMTRRDGWMIVTCVSSHSSCTMVLCSCFDDVAYSNYVLAADDCFEATLSCRRRV